MTYQLFLFLAIVPCREGAKYLSFQEHQHNLSTTLTAMLSWSSIENKNDTHRLNNKLRNLVRIGITLTLDILARPDLILPLRWLDVDIDARNVDTGVQACLLVRLTVVMSR